MLSNRRSFIAGAATLIATAVVAPASAFVRPKSSTDEIIERLKRNEIIENETFFLDKPLILDCPNSSGGIKNCTFTANFTKASDRNLPLITLVGRSFSSFTFSDITITAMDDSYKCAIMTVMDSRFL